MNKRQFAVLALFVTALVSTAPVVASPISIKTTIFSANATVNSVLTESIDFSYSMVTDTSNPSLTGFDSGPGSRYETDVFISSVDLGLDSVRLVSGAFLYIEDSEIGYNPTADTGLGFSMAAHTNAFETGTLFEFDGTPSLANLKIQGPVDIFLFEVFDTLVLENGLVIEFPDLVIEASEGFDDFGNPLPSLPVGTLEVSSVSQVPVPPAIVAMCSFLFLFGFLSISRNLSFRDLGFKADR